MVSVGVFLFSYTVGFCSHSSHTLLHCVGVHRLSRDVSPGVSVEKRRRNLLRWRTPMFLQLFLVLAAVVSQRPPHQQQRYPRPRDLSALRLFFIHRSDDRSPDCDDDLVARRSYLNQSLLFLLWQLVRCLAHQQSDGTLQPISQLHARACV